MRKSPKKLTLSRDTLRSLTGSLREVAAGSGTCSVQCTFYVSCPPTCANTCNLAFTCIFC